jgi:hypothetical protein
MSCAPFNPNLPFETPIEQAVWLTRWTTNLLNSTCLQSACGHACLPGNSFTGDSCRACLKTAQCNQTLNCINCVGLDTNNFTEVYNCTVAPGLSVGEILGITLGCILGTLLIIFLVFLILYKMNKLPIKTKLWIDNIGKHDKATQPYDLETIHNSTQKLKSSSGKVPNLDEINYSDTFNPNFPVDTDL